MHASTPSATSHRRADETRWWWWLVLIGATLSGACDSSGTSAEREVASAYERIIEWYAERSPSESDTPVVFVMALGEGLEIALSLQAAVLDRTADHSDVRFVDDAAEAVGDGDAVRDEDTLLAVGPVAVEGSRATVDVNEIHTTETMNSWTFELAQSADESRLARPPTTGAP